MNKTYRLIITDHDGEDTKSEEIMSIEFKNMTEDQAMDIRNDWIEMMETAAYSGIMKKYFPQQYISYLQMKQHYIDKITNNN